MRRSWLLAWFVTLSTVSGEATAQARAAVPAVAFRFEPSYQGVVVRDTERRDPEDDVRWVERRAEALTDFYAASGTRLVRLLAEYAGVEWPYEDIEVYLVRSFPTLSIQYPLTIAVGTIQQGEGRQEVPSGDFLTLTFAHQITHWLLDPPPEALAADRPRGLAHPLMEEGNYRREALVNLVTYRALEDIWGRQKLRRATEEPLWQSYNPEGEFIDSLDVRWSLSASRPLVTWLLQEESDGPTVRLAERLEGRRGGGEAAGAGGETARPGGGLAGSDVGFDLGQTAEGRLFIAFLDPRSAADSAGLRAGDIVLTIEGRRFTTPSDAMRTVREAWEANGEVNLSVERQGKEVFFQVH